jgi:C4-dicarboxylate-specific signal transduction histidine kinase
MRGAALFALGVLVGAVPLLVVCARLAALSARRRVRERALRAALEARLWEDRIEHADPQETDPEELRRRRHEANNALSTALLSGQFLLTASGAEAARSQPSADQHLAAEELVDALQRLKRLIGQGAAATTTGPRASLVSPTELLEGVMASAARARARYPRVAVEVTLASAALERARVAVCAGADGLARVLDALLENACEGDGARAASRVAVRVGAEGEVDVVSLEIADDGPGFAQDRLVTPPPAFTTTKSDRLGLGLYTAERILFASGGSLKRENAPSGGARLTVFLPAATEPPRAQ